MKIRFSPIKPEDMDKVLNLFKEAAEKISKMGIDHWQYWKNPPVEKVKWVKDGILNNEFFFVRNGRHQMIGMVRILEDDFLYWGPTADKSRYIHSLVVVPKYTGKGIGKKILQSIEEEARKEGYQYLRLDSDSKNPKLCQYYEKQGFEKAGTKVLPLSSYNLYQKKLVD